MHPLVLLHAVDHYNRVAKDTKKRVVGILLGETQNGVIEATSSYALPFEEDERDPSIWFLDHSYHEEMYKMCRKVNVREKLVGWYTTGPKIRAGDLQARVPPSARSARSGPGSRGSDSHPNARDRSQIDRLVRRYTSKPVMVIIDVQPKKLGIPTEAYFAVEEVIEGQQLQWTFKHVASEIGATEAEEVGVEHLLRDVKDMTISTLSNQITQKLSSLQGLASRLQEVDAYLQNVLSGRLPINHQIIYGLQDVFNLLPNTNVDELVKAFAVKTNDMMLAVYLSSIIRSVLALHNLINNKLYNKEKQLKQEKGDADDKEKAKDKADGKENEKADGKADGKDKPAEKK